MPNLNGFETLKAVRAKGIETPVIMVTSVNKMENIAASLEAGANDSPGETQILNLNDVEEGFLKRGEVEFRYATLERAEKLSLLKLDKTAQPSAIIIDNHFLDYGLRSLAVIREVTVENKDSGNSKKSLLY